MKRLFTSATLRLTGWYLLILTCISLLFSVLVYQIATDETERRIVEYHDKSQSLLQLNIGSSLFEAIRVSEMEQSKANIIGALVYLNTVVFITGGALSYLLARRTLRPIEEAHTTQARFLGDASHELRTPLAAMMTELEVALSDPDLQKKDMREILTSNLEEVQRLNTLSNTLLALSSGRNESLEKHPFDLRTSAQEVIDRLQGATQRHLTLDAPKTLPPAVGHQPAIEELLTVLLDNALKYSPNPSPVTLRLRQQHNRLNVCIVNQGEGIDKKHLPHIFERFYRIDQSRAGEGGYGLGLSLAQQIANSHSTQVIVESTPNSTTKFSFSLPTIRHK